MFEDNVSGGGGGEGEKMGLTHSGEELKSCVLKLVPSL